MHILNKYLCLIKTFLTFVFSNIDDKEKDNDKTVTNDTVNSTVGLPEGFFDDPVQDAKVLFSSELLFCKASFLILMLKTCS